MRKVLPHFLILFQRRLRLTKIAKNKTDKLEKEIRALKTELDLLEFLQLKINNSNLDERKESDKKIIKKYLIEINYATFWEMQEDYSNKYKENELEELQLKKKLILFEQKKKTIEKSISELENHIIDLERQPLSQGEIVSISFQFLYKIAFILTIELIAFFLLRQYRLSLDEARYFSNLLKDNENNITASIHCGGELCSDAVHLLAPSQLSCG
jgi:hypothetical protein